MWFYSRHLDGRLSFSECRHHDDIFCSSDSKVCPEYYVLSAVFSLESDILSLSHILISICFECSEMFADGTFSDIASARVGDLESSES